MSSPEIVGCYWRCWVLLAVLVVHHVDLSSSRLIPGGGVVTDTPPGSPAPPRCGPDGCECLGPTGAPWRKVLCKFPFLHTGINLRSLNRREVHTLTITCASDLFLSRIRPGLLSHLSNLNTLEIIGCRLLRLTGDMFLGLTNLTTLMVKKASLEDITDETWIKNLANLQNLDLTINNIRNIPVSLFCATQLKNINLTATGLWNTSLLGLNQREPSKPCIKDLVSMDLSYNFIQKFDLELGRNFPNLKGFLIKFSEVEFIHPQVFFNLTMVKEIDLTGNFLTEIDNITFHYHPELEALSLAHNNMSKINIDLSVTFPSLKNINFRENKLTKICQKSGTQRRGTLERVEVASNNLARIGQIFQDISVTHIQVMTLSDNGIEYIPNGTFRDFSNLTNLYIKNNKLKAINNDSFLGLFELKLLSLTNNAITTISPKAFDHCPLLVELNLQKNNLHGFPEAIFHLSNLQSINMKNNFITEINPEHLQMFMKPQAIRIDRTHDGWIPDFLMKKTFQQFRRPDFEFSPIEDNSDPSNGNPESNLKSYVKLRLHHNGNQSVSHTYLYVLLLKDTTHLYLQFRPYQESNIILIDLAFNKIRKVGGFDYDILHLLPANNLEAKNEVAKLSNSTSMKFEVLIHEGLQCHCRLYHLKELLSTAMKKNNIMINELSKEPCANEKIKKWMKATEVPGERSICITDKLCNSSFCYTCPSECSCLDDYRPRSSIIDCTNAHLQQVPKEIPGFLTHLSLSLNDIKNLHRDSFPNYSKLVTLDLSNTNLDHIEEDAFQPLYSLEKLYLQHNNLQNLSNSTFNFLHSLQILDLSFNELNHIEPHTFSSLTNLKELYLSGNRLIALSLDQFDNLPLISISLGNNTWSCECSVGQYFRYWLMSRTATVIDISEITCPVYFTNSSDSLNNESNSSISHLARMAYPIQNFSNNSHSNNLTSMDIVQGWISILEVNFTQCEEGFYGGKSGNEGLVISTVSFLISYSILTILFCVVLNHYRKTLKIQLYSRCPRFIKRRLRPITKGSVQKTFDVFVVYSPQDWQCVITQIIPGLHHSSHYLKVCVDYYNWPGGKFITNTIITCVERSRFTILVVSNSFLQHQWCNFGFQMAQQQMLKDADHQLIVVLMPDLDPTHLSPDLKRHLTAGKFVRWGDPGFWRKIRYLIPHRNLEPEKHPEIIRVPDGFM